VDIEEDEADVPEGAVRINGAQRLVRIPVRLVISDQHAGLVAPLARVFQGNVTTLCWILSGPSSTANAGRLRYPPVSDAVPRRG
jgi:hypothetical protein